MRIPAPAMAHPFGKFPHRAHLTLGDPVAPASACATALTKPGAGRQGQSILIAPFGKRHGAQIQQIF